MTSPADVPEDALAEVPARRAGGPVSPAALLLLLAWLACGAVLVTETGPTGAVTFAFVLIGWMLSVMIHEFGHALVAWLGGDPTVEGKGYLTLDPFRYMDSMTSLILPIIVLAIGGIGLPGGAVYLRPDLMRNAAWRSASSLAGPVGTLLVMLALAGVLWAAPGPSPFAAAVSLLAFLQATALILNLLPIPGLDGYGALSPFLPAEVERRLRPLGGVAFIALVLLMFTVPAVGGLLFGSAFALSRAMGVDPEGVTAGWSAFQFWR